jgi:hypothetical protein
LIQILIEPISDPLLGISFSTCSNILIKSSLVIVNQLVHGHKKISQSRKNKMVFEKGNLILGNNIITKLKKYKKIKIMKTKFASTKELEQI